MVMDALGPEFILNQTCEEQPPNPEAQKFFDLLKDADEPLWDGCKNHNKLSAMAQLLNIKSEYNISEACYDRLMSVIRTMLPEGEKLPNNLFKTKKQLAKLGLGYGKIDACVNNCMLYYKENKDKQQCLVCGHPRYKPRKSGARTNVPFKVLRYLPLIPTLQRLYASNYTCEHVTWHANNLCEEGSMAHPSHRDAWKHFNRTHPSFASDARNFYEEKRQQFPRITDMELDIIRDRDFPQWLLAHIQHTQNEVDDVYRKLANGPSRRVSCYKGYFVNGFKFHIVEYGQSKTTTNYGVCVLGSTYSECEVDYYGLLEDVVELEYYGLGMVTRGRGKGRRRGRERGRGQGQESDQGVNEELLGVHLSRVEQTTSSNALSREPDPNTEVDETSVGLGNDPIIGEPSDGISSQSRRRGPNRGSQVPEHPDQRLNVTVINNR
ncbi:UNVERIFIED_CONTAM: hypothetical protein Sradi_4521700 [Sesamum radiatum]|uniref:Transposase n=1 Tax=Sesamum radiatum TaxID=300843 RepID=A0AAW2N8G6_SESRA